MRVHVLIENTSCHSDLVAEHGLSLLIETAAGLRILFDAGATAAFADNAQHMGVDLASVDVAVLSHGHFDHGGGLARFLELNHHAPIWVSPHAFDAHYNANGKNIGLSPELRLHPQIRMLHAEQLELAPGVQLHRASNMPTPHGAEGQDMTTVINGERVADDFRHEQYLQIEEKGKRILIVDDVISTGQSLLALEKLVELAGGNIVGKMAVLAEGHAATRDDITVLGPLPLFDAEGKPLPIQ